MALLLVFAAAFRGTGDGAGGQAEALSEASAETCVTVSADVARLEQCLAAQPDEVGVMLDLAKAYEAAGRRDEAEGLYRRALRLDPRDGDLHLGLGRVLLARGDAAGAASQGHEALATQPGNPEAFRLVEAAAGMAGP